MRHAAPPSVVTGAGSTRLLVLAVVALMVAACGTASSPRTFGPTVGSTPTVTPGPSLPTAAAAPAATAILAGTVALPTLTAAEAAAAANCLRGTGYWVLRGSATGRWLTWAEGIEGPEMQLVWPTGYRARFTPLLEVLAPDGTVVAREGAPITTACELGSRLVYPDGLIPPNVAPTPVGGLPEATLTPVMQWPTSAVQSLQPGFAIYGPASAGTIGTAPRDNTGGTLVLSDAPGAAPRGIAAIPAGHEALPIALSADWVVWVEQWYGPRATASGVAGSPAGASSVSTPGCLYAGQPLDWRVMAAPRDGGATNVVATGTNVRGGGECDWIAGPGLALSGDRVAWTAEAARTGHPNATTLTVRSLTSGETIRRVSSDGTITGITLDGQALLYREMPPDGAPGQVLFVADDAEGPTVLPGAANGAIGGGRIAWTSDAGDGSVWTAAEGSIRSAVRLAAPVDPAFISQGANPIVVEGDVVAWIAQGVLGDTGTTRVVVWRSGWPSARLMTGYGQPSVLQLAGGWLAWDSSLGWMDGPPAGTYRAPLTALP